MTEWEIKRKFASENLEEFKNIFNLDSISLYALEFPIVFGKENYKIDMLLEEPISKIPMENQLFVLEFKKDKIFHSALDQLNLYCTAVVKKLYRKKEAVGILAAPYFSDWEIQECKRQDRFCLQYDLQGKMRLL